MRKSTLLIAAVFALSAPSYALAAKAKSKEVAKEKPAAVLLMRDGWRTIVVQPVHSVFRPEKK